MESTFISEQTRQTVASSVVFRCDFFSAEAVDAVDASLFPDPTVLSILVQSPAIPTLSVLCSTSNVVSPATESVTSEYLPTKHSRFDALIAFLHDQKALGIYQVTWSDIRRRIRTRIAADGSQLPVQTFLREAEREELVVVSGKGQRDVVSLVETSSSHILAAGTASITPPTMDLTIPTSPLRSKLPPPADQIPSSTVSERSRYPTCAPAT